MTTPIFSGNQLVSGDMFAKLQELTKNRNKGSGTGGIARISLKGGKFRKIVGGQQMEVSREPVMNIIVVGVAPLSRTYYAGAYDPENPAPPTCWSTDTSKRTPAAEVPADTRQSSSCESCPKNVKGSGQGESRACRFSMRLAVMIEGDLSTVYQLNLSSLSTFGDGTGQYMPFLKYQNFLDDNGAPIFAVVTEMAFDENADVPKVFFKPVRTLEEDELNTVANLDAAHVKKLITMTVAQADGVQAIKLPKTPEPIAEEGDEIFAEPKKVTSKAKAKPQPATVDYDAIAEEWDD